jgi:hypothetical protein
MTEARARAPLIDAKKKAKKKGQAPLSLDKDACPFFFAYQRRPLR